LTVASRAERAAAEGSLEELSSSFAKDPEIHALLADIAEHKHDEKAAAGHWDRAFQLGPLWLPHRYLQCWYEARQHHPEGVDRIARHMAEVAPDSPWTRLVFDRFSTTARRPAGAAKPATPVVEYHQQLAVALRLAQDGDLSEARRSLGKALAAVQDQAPFVLDAFDWLVDARLQVLARELTSFEAWPRSDPWAAAKLAELETGAGPAAAAAPKPEPPPQATVKGKHPKKKIATAKKKGGRAKPAKLRHRR
jgi:hypothetical protein